MLLLEVINSTTLGFINIKDCFSVKAVCGKLVFGQM